jgi:opacity protein-like surface antigen
MRHWMLALALNAAVVGGAAPAGAQALGVEARLDAGVPVDESDNDYDAGVGFGLRASLDVAPTFAVYGGYSRFQFEEDDVLGGGEAEFDSFELGGRLSLAGDHGRTNPYFLLGAVFLEDNDTGIEAGIGAEHAVSWELSVTPEVRYRQTLRVHYLALGMGLRFRF